VNVSPARIQRITVLLPDGLAVVFTPASGQALGSHLWYIAWRAGNLSGSGDVHIIGGRGSYGLGRGGRC
jgi:hypothetical protein